VPRKTTLTHAAYDLLNGPYRYLSPDPRKIKPLLDQARTLADSLSVAFDTPSGVPDPTIFLNPEPRHSGAGRNNIAEIGTLVLEWTRLSDLTGDDKYAKLVAKAESYLLNPTGSPEAWPGLVGTFVSTEDGTFQDSNGGWSAYDDSFYEYLIKMYLYDSEAYGEYRDRWIKAADSTIEHLTSHPSTREDLTFLSQYRGQTTIPTSAHCKSHIHKHHL
jgi:mannosyl-oligosaccharide alpha-1,2-mannosidase